MLLIQSILVYSIFSILMWNVSRCAVYPQTKANYNYTSRISIYYWWCIVIFCIISGLRWDVGVDHLSYLDNYIEMCEGRYYARDRGIELGYLAISMFFAKLDIHYIFYMAFLAFLQIYFIVKAYRNERHIMPYVLVLIVLGGYYFSWMNGIRQNIVACAFVYFSRYINQKKLWKYLFCVLLAYTMHSSALLLIPVYILAYDKLTWNRTWLNLLIFFACFVIGQTPTFVSSMTRLGDVLSFVGYDYYSDMLVNLTDASSFRSFNFGPRMLVNLLTYITCILLYGRTSKYFNSSKFNLAFKLFFIGVCWNYLFINTLDIFLRPNFYFIIFALPITAYTLYYLFATGRKIFYSILLVFSLSFNFLSCYSDYNQSDLTLRRSQLYQFCFEHLDGK